MGSDSVSKAKAETEESGFHWKVAHGLNLHKLFCAPVIYALMVWYDCFTPAAWIYLATHGTYGYMWLVKELIFPDKTFQQPTGFEAPLAAFFICSVPYWSIPWILVAHARNIPLWYQSAAIVLFCVGMFIMNGADCQKTFTLRLAPGKLITTGFFKHIRHPNYLGEICIYICFSMLTGTAWGFLPVFITVFSLFLPNTYKKERSMSRYPEFAAWKASTYHMLPPFY